jgi:hypothetical protein
MFHPGALVCRIALLRGIAGVLLVRIMQPVKK